MKISKEKFKKKVIKAAKSKVDELYGYTFNNEVWKAQKALNWAMNESLYRNYKGKMKKLSQWELFKINLKVRISEIRVNIAEWIGGEDLHSNCGDY